MCKNVPWRWKQVEEDKGGLEGELIPGLPDDVAMVPGAGAEPVAPRRLPRLDRARAITEKGLTPECALATANLTTREWRRIGLRLRAV